MTCPIIQVIKRFMLFVAMSFEHGTVFHTVMNIFCPYMYVNAGYEGLEFHDEYCRYTKGGGVSRMLNISTYIPVFLALLLPERSSPP